VDFVVVGGFEDGLLGLDERFTREIIWPSQRKIDVAVRGQSSELDLRRVSTVE